MLLGVSLPGSAFKPLVLCDSARRSFSLLVDCRRRTMDRRSVMVAVRNSGDDFEVGWHWWFISVAVRNFLFA